MPVYPPKPPVPVLNLALAKELGVVFALPLTERGGNPRDAASKQPVASSGAWGTGAFGPHITLDGSSAYIEAAHEARFDLDALKAWTIGVWVYTTATPDNLDTLIAQGFDSNKVPWNIDVRSGVFAVNQFPGSGGSEALSATTAADAVGRWLHIAGTRDASLLKIYINGVLEGQGSSNATAIINAGAVRVGSLYGVGRHYPGHFASALLCNRALTQNQISRLYLDPWALYRVPPRKVFYSYVVQQVVHELAGTIAGQATASAALARLRGIAGTSSAQATAAGDAMRLRGLQGTIAATATATGTLARLRGLAGEIAGTTILSGALGRLRAVAGTIAALLTAAGNLTIPQAHTLAPRDRRARVLFENRTATVSDEDD